MLYARHLKPRCAASGCYGLHDGSPLLLTVASLAPTSCLALEDGCYACRVVGAGIVRSFPEIEIYIDVYKRCCYVYC